MKIIISVFLLFVIVFGIKAQKSIWEKPRILITNLFPGKENSTNYPLENTWFTDKSDSKLFDGKYQGRKTISKWKNDILLDWAKRWE